MSRVGKKIIPIPKGVELKIEGCRVTAKGPKGELSCEVTDGIEIEIETERAMVRQTSAEKNAGAMHGLSRALVNNLVEGVSNGFSKVLEVHGTGFRAQVQGTKLVLTLGFSSPIEYSLPEGVGATVEGNRITEVVGEGSQAAEMREYFAVDEARRNIAELGLGCNDKAVISGVVLEDEKVLGMHWAYGLSDHLGGTVGVGDFCDPSHAVHQDIVYAKGGVIEVASLVLEYENGTSEEIIKDGQYTIF